MATKTTSAPSVRVPFADFVSILAKIAGSTEAEAEKWIGYFVKAFTQVFAGKKNQELEIPELGVFEERTVSGKLSKALGGLAFIAQALSFRASSIFKAAIQAKSTKALADGSSQLLSEEEYDAILAGDHE